MCVCDDGPGIPESGISESVRLRMFDPFFMAEPVGQGTDLGVDIVRRIVDRNDGVISVDSEPGRTECRVTLPAVR